MRNILIFIDFIGFGPGVLQKAFGQLQEALWGFQGVLGRLQEVLEGFWGEKNDFSLVFECFGWEGWTDGNGAAAGLEP